MLIAAVASMYLMFDIFDSLDMFSIIQKMNKKDNTQPAGRSRALTPEQIRLLQRTWDNNQHPSNDEISLLSRHTGLPSKKVLYIGPILDDRLKEIPETLKGGPLYSLYVCLSVCTRAKEHTFWPRDLIFWSSDPWDMRKKNDFFSKFTFLRFFIGIFRFFPYITLVFFVSSYRSQFFT